MEKVHYKSYLESFDPSVNSLHVAIPCYALIASGESHNSALSFIESAVLQMVQLGFNQPEDISAKLCLPAELVRYIWALERDKGNLANSNLTQEAVLKLKTQENNSVSFNLLQEGLSGQLLPILITHDRYNMFLESDNQYSIGDVGQDLRFNFDLQVDFADTAIAPKMVKVSEVARLARSPKLYYNAEAGKKNENYQNLRNINVDLEQASPFYLHCICRLDSADQVVVSFFEKDINVSMELTSALRKVKEYDLIRYRLLLDKLKAQSSAFAALTRTPILQKSVPSNPDQAVKQPTVGDPNTFNQQAASNQTPDVAANATSTQPTGTTSNQSNSAVATPNTSSSAGTVASANATANHPADAMPNQSNSTGTTSNTTPTGMGADSTNQQPSSAAYKHPSGERLKLFGTQYTELEKCLCQINLCYQSLHKNADAYAKGQAVQQYHSDLQNCILNLNIACEYVLKNVIESRQSQIDISNFNQAYFGMAVETLKLRLLPDLQVLADLLPQNNANLSSLFLDKLTQQPYAEVVKQLAWYCKRHDYSLLICELRGQALAAADLKSNAGTNGFAGESSMWDFPGHDLRTKRFTEDLPEYSAPLYAQVTPDAELQAGMKEVYEWCQTLETQLKSITKFDLSYDANEHKHFNRNLIMALLDAIKNGGIFSQMFNTHPQFIANLIALRQLRNAWAHSGTDTRPVSIKTVNCFYAMLLTLLKLWNVSFVDILQADLGNINTLQSKLMLDLNVKISLLHYFDHNFMDKLTPDLRFELYAAESALQEAKICDVKERNLPVYLSNQPSGSESSFLGANGANSLNQSIQGKPSTPSSTSTPRSPEKLVPAKSLIKLASFYQLWILHQLLDCTYQAEPLLQKGPGLIRELAVKLRAAGFILTNNDLPVGLYKINPGFIQGAIRKSKSTLGGYLVVWLSVLSSQQLSNLASSWPTLVLDINELIGLRQHGSTEEIAFNRALQLKSRLYLHLPDASTSIRTIFTS